MTLSFIPYYIFLNIQIAEYTKNTHARTHSNYSVDIVQIFRVSREGEAERFKKVSQTQHCCHI